MADALIKAADAIIAEQYHNQFVVDRFQAGAGTSHNMNTNEVIANLANVATSGKKGEYQPAHPNDHVNMEQSTNDTIPTAIRLAVPTKLHHAGQSQPDDVRNAESGLLSGDWPGHCHCAHDSSWATGIVCHDAGAGFGLILMGGTG